MSLDPTITPTMAPTSAPTVARDRRGGRGALLAWLARAAERGQSTAEYALVLLGAATVALVFVAWAGRTGRIGDLFDTVIDDVIGRI